MNAIHFQIYTRRLEKVWEEDGDTWDGTTNEGKVSSGLYLAKIKDADPILKDRTAKVIVVK